jgi:hypothetical protein
MASYTRPTYESEIHQPLTLATSFDEKDALLPFNLLNLLNAEENELSAPDLYGQCLALLNRQYTPLI